MPVVSENKRVLCSIAALGISAFGIGAFTWYKRNRRKSPLRPIEPTEETETTSTCRDEGTVTESEKVEAEAKAAEMPVERRGRQNYRRNSPPQPSSPEKSPKPLPQSQTEKESPSWSEVVSNPEVAERLAAEFSTQCKMEAVETEGVREEEEVRRVMEKQPLLTQVSPGSSSSASSSKQSNPTVESPFSTSDLHSEASQDSGRGGSMRDTNGPSMSPVGELEPIEVPPFYEFEIPKSIVGLIIGKKGVVIKDLTTKSGTFILIRDHHLKEEFKICSIEGTRNQINGCLRMIRRRFPPSKYPELNLNPVLPPPITSPTHPWGAGVLQLSLPDGVRCETQLTCIVDANHVFLQQPTHPSFPALAKLDQYMNSIYSQTIGVPQLPKPVETGVICAAPSLDGWYRALTCIYYEDTEEVLIKFVDYGGYSRQPASDLKQIRSDFMALPFQATECYLHNIYPVDVDEGLPQEACTLVQELTKGKGVEAEVISYAPDEMPCVELYAPSHYTDELISVNRVLIDSGYAAEPMAESTYNEE